MIGQGMGKGAEFSKYSLFPPTLQPSLVSTGMRVPWTLSFMWTFRGFLFCWASLVAQLGYDPPATWRLGSIPGWGRFPGMGGYLHPVSAWEFHALYSPWGHKEVDRTEWLFTSHSLSHIDWLNQWLLVIMSTFKPLSPTPGGAKSLQYSNHLVHSPGKQHPLQRGQK